MDLRRGTPRTGPSLSVHSSADRAAAPGAAPSASTPAGVAVPRDGQLAPIFPGAFRSRFGAAGAGRADWPLWIISARRHWWDAAAARRGRFECAAPAPTLGRELPRSAELGGGAGVSGSPRYPPREGGRGAPGGTVAAGSRLWAAICECGRSGPPAPPGWVWQVPASRSFPSGFQWCERSAALAGGALGAGLRPRRLGSGGAARGPAWRSGFPGRDGAPGPGLGGCIGEGRAQAAGGRSRGPRRVAANA